MHNEDLGVFLDIFKCVSRKFKKRFKGVYGSFVLQEVLFCKKFCFAILMLHGSHRSYMNLFP